MAKRNILCVIDFSESSVHALKWTLDIAQHLGCQVTVLFCYRLIPENGDVTLDMKRNIEAEALQKFHEIEKKIGDYQTVPYHFVTEVGFFSTRIEAFIRKSPVDGVVIGTAIIQRFNEYENLSFDQFMRKSKVPVVIVPDEVKPVASDLNT